MVQIDTNKHWAESRISASEQLAFRPFTGTSHRLSLFLTLLHPFHLLISSVHCQFNGILTRTHQRSRRCRPRTQQESTHRRVPIRAPTSHPLKPCTLLTVCTVLDDIYVNVLCGLPLFNRTVMLVLHLGAIAMPLGSTTFSKTRESDPSQPD